MIWPPVKLELGPSGSTKAGAGWQTFSWDLQLWKQVTLKPFNLQILYLQNKKDLTLFKKYTKNQEARCVFRINFACSNWPHFHRTYLVTVFKWGATAIWVFEKKSKGFPDKMFILPYLSAVGQFCPDKLGSQDNTYLAILSRNVTFFDKIQEKLTTKIS